MSNSDNQMTRFLFAILKQKNLKDIDWNAVAHDPVLSQPITNGHAARMRYSRFRSGMLGLEPQKRNRTNTKNKVTKPKKDQKTIKPEDLVKAEPGLNNRNAYSDIRSGSPLNVKQETSQPMYHQNQYTPTSMASPAGPESHSAPQMRLLTPCSDDMLTAPHPMHFSPPASVLGAFDMPQAGPCVHEHEHHLEAGQDHTLWPGSPAFSAFDAAYNLDEYSLGGTCDHHLAAHQDGQQGVAGMGLGVSGHVGVKAEQWDPSYRR
ncbi:hypothetical protein ACHAQA_007411 [Verticillium albo-atrum]